MTGGKGPNGRRGAAARHPARRPGAVVIALLFGTTALALALTLKYHLGVPGALVTFVFGLPSLYLGWAALQEARYPQDERLAQIADGLAGRLGFQWQDEAEARGLNEPYPLPVSWTAADAHLGVDLDTLRTLATSGYGWWEPTRKAWATGPKDLASGGRKLADVLAAVPTGRLVVLGEPGAGKTMLMVGLVLDLLARRSPGGLVPVLAPLASWDPVSQDLHTWLGATLITNYPDLAAAPPPGSAGSNRFEALLAAGLILPILDGLDEIPESARPRAITRINAELKPGEQVVVTSRSEQYRATVRPQDGQGVILRAAAVQLGALEFDQVAGYLRQDAGPAGSSRWGFLKTLGPESPVRQALATPLMAGLARTIYNPRPGEHAGTVQDPAELSDFPNRAAVEAHLLDAFIPAAYRPFTAGRWTAEQAETWLVFLAGHLEKTTRKPDLAWWELWLAIPPRSHLHSWVDSKSRPKAPARGMRISTRVFGRALAAGIAGGLALGILFALGGGPVGFEEELFNGLGVGLMLSLMASVGFGLVAMPGNVAGATTPGAVLARDRHTAILYTVASVLAAIVIAVGIGVTVGWGTGPGTATDWGGVALMLGCGIICGLALSLLRTEWPSYMIVKTWLAFHRRVPWPLMDFLADAHSRGVLRQTGAVYQFRHIELQRRLAKREGLVLEANR
jgi:hypothetical protein